MEKLNLELSPTEAATLRRVLVSYLSDLRAEIADTERVRMRAQLKGDEATINRLVALLADAPA